MSTWLSRIKQKWRRDDQDDTSSRSSEHSLIHKLTQEKRTIDNAQLSSPLYARIPTEIRQQILRLVLFPIYTDSASAPCRTNRFKEFIGPINMAPFITCKRAYREAYDYFLPELMKSHVLWSYQIPTSLLHSYTRGTHKPRALTYFTQMTTEQRQFVQRIRIVTDLNFHLGSYSTSIGELFPNLKRLTITIQLPIWERPLVPVYQISAWWGLQCVGTLNNKELVFEIEGLEEDWEWIDTTAIPLLNPYFASSFGFGPGFGAGEIISRHDWYGPGTFNRYSRCHHRGMLADAHRDEYANSSSFTSGVGVFTYHGIAIRWRCEPSFAESQA